MTITPSLEEFRSLSQEGNLIPVYHDLMADFETPVSAYAKLRSRGPSFLFESIEGGEHIGRYTFIGCRPRKIFRIFPEKTEVESKNGSRESLDTPSDPLSLIEAEMEQYRAVDVPDLPPFVGGAVGAIGYEYIHHIEPRVSRPTEDTLGLPTLYFLITDSLVVFDRARQTMRILVSAHVEEDPEHAYREAVREIEAMVQLLSEPSLLSPASLSQTENEPLPAGNFTREGYESVVEQTKEYIRAGDIIQGVISQRFQIPYAQSALDLYRALRVVNPSPYMFLLEAEQFSVIGASPEVHVRLTHDQAELRPIAGTRPRGENREEDVAYEKDLLADEKEKAEHLMLVDLARNDLGRVCKIGSITVPEYMVVERYSHVMHIVSQVTGELDPEKNAFDLMRATFPAGTVSGAPKIRAMEIIAELENLQRGIYAGALGYFSYDGNCDSCIAIRTAILQDGVLNIQAGAGLVADSVPATEFEETVNKARGLLQAVALSKKFKL